MHALLDQSSLQVALFARARIETRDLAVDDAAGAAGRSLREGWTAETSVSTGLLCAYLVVGGLYAAVHLEPRYLTPVVPGSIVIGFLNLSWLLEQYRNSQRPVVGAATA